MDTSAFRQYAGHCGWALARAHARTGDSVTISGYIGTSDSFGEAIADWATGYADQTERDHAALVAAIERGVLPVAEAS
jgi:sugar/nucleoside kinase (ribokinase family)